jgi:2-phosphosulfolactate phosphatase
MSRVKVQSKKKEALAALEEAIEYRKKGCLVAAERKGQIVEGFKLGNSPLTYADNKFKGETIVITTANGTTAILTARKAQTVVIGSLLNLDALGDWLMN